ncbi:MAG: DJ-1/PfpI family protein [Puniceicoccales bacterium]|jgi:4-methyl-5(b-hydroxyethyl)-thiazole monophosphate biosynthesis|nr:DJ-1/PfpI family protein [Puniceicoccales bacterium]
MNGEICVVFGDGVEEMELVTPVDIFARSGMWSRLFSAKNSPHVTGAHGIKFIADGVVEKLDCSIYDCLVIPGGPGSFVLKDNRLVLETVKKFSKSGKVVCAICAAPIVLHSAGILEGKKFCSHQCVHDVLKNADKTDKVVVDGNLITANGPGAATEFALAIVTRLCGKRVASHVAEDMSL